MHESNYHLTAVGLKLFKLKSKVDEIVTKKLHKMKPSHMKITKC